METIIYPHERLEDLDLKGLKIIQDPDYFCFGIDAVLLANFAAKSCHAKTRLIDLCTGSGIIPLLLTGHTPIKYIDALEIQPHMAALAKRNMILNDLDENIHVYEGDLRYPHGHFHSSYYDVITCNPPYMPLDRGIKSPKDPMAIARHEITCTIEDVAEFARVYLKDKGKLFLIHRADRLIDIAFALRSKGIEIKRLRLISPFRNKPANLVLIEAMKKGRPALIAEPPLIIYNDDGSYTEEINIIYGTDSPKLK